MFCYISVFTQNIKFLSSYIRYFVRFIILWSLHKTINLSDILCVLLYFGLYTKQSIYQIFCTFRLYFGLYAKQSVYQIFYSFWLIFTQNNQFIITFIVSIERILPSFSPTEFSSMEISHQNFSPSEFFQHSTSTRHNIRIFPGGIFSVHQQSLPHRNFSLVIDRIMHATRTAQEVENFVAKTLKNCQKCDIQNESLWKIFCEEFMNYNVVNWELVFTNFIHQFRNFLRKRGVWIRKNVEISIATTMTETAHEEFSTQWIEKELKKFNEIFDSYVIKCLYETDFERKPRDYVVMINSTSTISSTFGSVWIIKIVVQLVLIRKNEARQFFSFRADQARVSLCFTFVQPPFLKQNRLIAQAIRFRNETSPSHTSETVNSAVENFNSILENLKTVTKITDHENAQKNASKISFLAQENARKNER